MELDDAVGQILAWLRTLGLDNNTFVFFTSDNGAAVMSGPEESKSTTHTYMHIFLNSPILEGLSIHQTVKETWRRGYGVTQSTHNQPHVPFCVSFIIPLLQTCKNGCHVLPQAVCCSRVLFVLLYQRPHPASQKRQL